MARLTQEQKNRKSLHVIYYVMNNYKMGTVDRVETNFTIYSDEYKLAKTNAEDKYLNKTYKSMLDEASKKGSYLDGLRYCSEKINDKEIEKIITMAVTKIEKTNPEPVKEPEPEPTKDNEYWDNSNDWETLKPAVLERLKKTLKIKVTSDRVEKNGTYFITDFEVGNNIQLSMRAHEGRNGNEFVFLYYKNDSISDIEYELGWIEEKEDFFYYVKLVCEKFEKRINTLIKKVEAEEKAKAMANEKGVTSAIKAKGQPKTEKEIEALYPEQIMGKKTLMHYWEGVPETINGVSPADKKEYNKIARYLNDYVNKLNYYYKNIAERWYQTESLKIYGGFWDWDAYKKEVQWVQKPSGFSYNYNSEYNDALKKYNIYKIQYDDLMESIKTGEQVISEIPELRKFLEDWKEKCIEWNEKKCKEAMKAFPEYFEAAEEIDYKKEHIDYKNDDWKALEKQYREERAHVYDGFEALFGMCWEWVEVKRKSNGYKEKDTLVSMKFKADECRKHYEQMAKDYYDEYCMEATSRVGKVSRVIEPNFDGVAGTFNAVFVGEKGKVKVQTVTAGGYNIQCFHLRTLWNIIK